MKVINNRKVQEWLRRWEFALWFFGSLAFFAVFASLEEILKNVGLT